MRILIVEDNKRLASLIAAGIATHGFASDVVGTLADADAALVYLEYDAIILDLKLPDGDGIKWLAERKSGACFPPVLILTARIALEHRIGGLDAGADDYCIKPIDAAEICARLRALLRRPGPRGPTLLTVGKLDYDIAQRVLRCDGADVPLTHREADLIELLMRKAGTVVRKSTIADMLGGLGEEVTANAIEAIVSRLRPKIRGNDGRSPLTTVRGMGYILMETAV